MRKILLVFLNIILIACANPDIVDVSPEKESPAIEAESKLDSFDQARVKRKDYLTGNSRLLLIDRSPMAIVDIASFEAEAEHWLSMNRSKDAELLWADLAKYRGDNQSFQIYQSYERLRELALLYNQETSMLYKNPQLKEAILFGLDWMNETTYNENQEIYGSWYHWRLGVPLLLNDLLVLMYDNLSDTQIEANIRTINHFMDDPTEWTGANRLEFVMVGVITGIISKNEKQILLSRDAISQVFEYVIEGDGFYEDGSFIQHDNFAYTGSYGVVLIESMAEILYILNESPWAVVDPRSSHVYNWYADSFAPFLYQGLMMDSVRGRAISRDYESDNTMGQRTILAFLVLAELAPESIAQEIKEDLKYHIIESIKFHQQLPAELSRTQMELVQSLLNDSDIWPNESTVGHYLFPQMDRVVHRRPDWTFTISMYSERIRNYESINEENLNGWYTGSGMTYLYMEDLIHYSDAFWPTVHPFRLAGTTSDGYTKNSETNEESWVGGTVLNDLYGTTGMSLNKSNIYQGKKSWFTFDDEVVALGAGITGTSDKHLLTTIENRRLSSNGKNDFSVNGVKQSSELDLEQVHSSVKWAHLKGDESRGSDIGYYFPDEPTLQSIRESRTGSWKDINGREQTPEKSMTRNYLNLTVDHGEKVVDGQYSYVLLPTKNEEETARYTKNPHVEILANSSKIQAIRENKLGIIAVNFWEAGRICHIQSNQPAAIMAQEDGQQIVLSVADPTQLQEKLVIEIGKKNLRIVESAATISVIQTTPSLIIEVDVSQGLGDSHQVIVK